VLIISEGQSRKVGTRMQIEPIAREIAEEIVEETKSSGAAGRAAEPIQTRRGIILWPI
jgi:hypothetical protein